MTTHDHIDPIIPWLDLSTYGLCVFKLDSGLQAKHWILVTGDIDTHAESLSLLGFKRSPRGVMFLPIEGDRWKLTPAWKRCFPGLSVRQTPLSTVLIHANQPTVVRREVAEPVADPASTVEHDAPESQEAAGNGSAFRGESDHVRPTEGAALGSAQDRQPTQVVPRGAAAAEPGDRDSGGDDARGSLAATPEEAAAAFLELASSEVSAGFKLTYSRIGTALRAHDLKGVCDFLALAENSVSRSKFTAITGVALPRTQSGSKVVIAEWMKGGPTVPKSAVAPRSEMVAPPVAKTPEAQETAANRTPEDISRHFAALGIQKTSGPDSKSFHEFAEALHSLNYVWVTDALIDSANKAIRVEFERLSGLKISGDAQEVRQIIRGWMPAIDLLKGSDLANRVESMSKRGLVFYGTSFVDSEDIRALAIDGTYNAEPAQFRFTGVYPGARPDQWMVMAEAIGGRVSYSGFKALSGIPIQGLLNTPELRYEFAQRVLPGFEKAPTPAPMAVSADVVELASPPAVVVAEPVLDVDIPLNFRIPDELANRLLNERSAETMRRQFEILSILDNLRDEARRASDDERSTLAGYSGWGPFAGELMDAAVRRLAGDHFAALIESTPNAFYTPVVYIDTMWQMARKAGFRGGRVLEPGAGAGWFIGRVPEELASATEFVAVEKEPLAAMVLEQLYPRAIVMPVDFRIAPIADNSVDLVIGNVPYGDERITDTRFPDTYSLHDYFLINSLRALRPGGVLVALTSTYTLDRVSPAARDVLYDTADMVAAFRLPMGALVKTQVSADIVVLRKRLSMEEPGPYHWRFSEQVDEGPSLNNAFRMGAFLPMGELFVHATNGPMGTRHAVRATMDIQEVAAKLIESTPADIVAERSAALHAVAAPVEDEAYDPQRIEGLFVSHGDGIASIEKGEPVPLLVKGKALDRLKQYIVLRDSARDVLRLQQDAGTDNALHIAQAELSTAYDLFIKKFGPVNQSSNRRAVLDDPFHDLVLALENFDPETQAAVKTEFFTERTIIVKKDPDPENALDALMASIDRYGRVNPSAMEGWLKRPWSAVRAELKGQIYDDPATGKPELAEIYCAGNLRDKLLTAQEAARTRPEYAENVEALSLALGAMKQRDAISVDLGAPWVAPKFYEVFLSEIVYARQFRVPTFTVTRDAMTSKWKVRCDHSPPEPPDYSTPHWKAKDLMEALMNGRIPKVFHPRDPSEVGPARLDEKGTLLADQKADALKKAFAAWVWNDEARALAIEQRFNETLNSHRGVRLRDLQITLPGLAGDKCPRPYQLRGVARVVLESNVLLAHWVGAGKTFTMAAAAVKLKQLGIADKSLLAVRKSNLYPIFTDAKRFFPGLRIAMIETTDLNPAGRKQFLRRIQTQRPDLIITTHEAFKKLGLPPEIEIQEISRALAKIERAVDDEQGSKSSANVKRLGKQLATMRARMHELLSEDDDPKRKKARETRVTLADLGIQALFVDEAQAFKNLQVVTSEQMLGIPTSMSARALDMSMKVRWLQSQGCRVVYATGTPITNSLVETYNLQRYLAPDQLRAAGLEEFDAWKSVFATPVMKIEPDPGGKGYRAVQRLAGMKNIPPLVDMLSSFTDVVTEEDLNILRPTAEHVTVEVQPTELQRLFRMALAEKTMIVRKLPETAKQMRINILTVLGEARRGALDLRALYPFIDDDAGGAKVAEVVGNVARIYSETRERLATQTIFCDLATPKGPGERGFSVYDAIKAGLIDAGVPAGAIAFIHDCRNDREKEQLFNRVNSGEVAVLLGSTEKMGEGCNIQLRLYAQHHLNAPYHPGQLTQRNGRIIRFGNLHAELGVHVKVFYYTTKGLLEDWNWSLVHTKQKFIDQVIGALASRSSNSSAELPSTVVEDAAAVDLGEIEAAASGDPRVKRKFALENRVRELAMLMQVKTQEQGQYKRRVRGLDEELKEKTALRREAVILAQQVEVAREARIAEGKGFEMRVFTSGPSAEPVCFDKRKDAGRALLEHIARLDERYQYTGTTQLVAMLDGMEIRVKVQPARVDDLIVGPLNSALSEVKYPSKDELGMVRSLEHAVEAIASRPEKLGYELQSLQQQRDVLESVLARSDDTQELYNSAERELAELNIALQSSNAVDVTGYIKKFHEELLSRYGNDGLSVKVVDETSAEPNDDEDEELSGPRDLVSFELLTEILPSLRDIQHVKLTASGFMDLVVETIRPITGHRQVVSLAHYYEQNGDLCSDPEMEIIVDWQNRTVVPQSFSMSGMGVYKQASSSITEANDQASFLVMWLRNIRAQGHVLTPLPVGSAVRNDSEPEQEKTAETDQEIRHSDYERLRTIWDAAVASAPPAYRTLYGFRSLWNATDNLHPLEDFVFQNESVCGRPEDDTFESALKYVVVVGRRAFIEKAADVLPDDEREARTSSLASRAYTRLEAMLEFHSRRFGGFCQFASELGAACQDEQLCRLAEEVARRDTDLRSVYTEQLGKYAALDVTLATEVRRRRGVG